MWEFAKRAVKSLLREIKGPFVRRKLAKIGSMFVRSYSETGDALLVISPVESENSEFVPVIDRPYEYAFVVEMFCKPELKGKTVLDFGSAGSVLPTIIASMGNDVVCYDVRNWPIDFPNVRFVRGDILVEKVEEKFDVLTCISVIEHVGLGYYGDKGDANGDIEAMKILRQCLKPGGFLILTVPFGKPTVVFPAYRVYDRSRLNMLTSGFKTLEERFCGPIEQPTVYRPCSEEEANGVDTSVDTYACPVVCCLLERQELI